MQPRAQCRALLIVAQGERTVVDTFLEHLSIASRAAETMVAAFEDTQVVTADLGTSLLKVRPLHVCSHDHLRCSQPMPTRAPNDTGRLHACQVVRLWLLLMEKHCLQTSSRSTATATCGTKDKRPDTKRRLHSRVSGGAGVQLRAGGGPRARQLHGYGLCGAVHGD